MLGWSAGMSEVMYVGRVCSRVCCVVCGVCYRFMFWFFFLRIRRPPRSTQSRSSAASDVYKRQVLRGPGRHVGRLDAELAHVPVVLGDVALGDLPEPVSYTHLRAHETPEHLVCRLLLEKKKTNKHN